MGSDHFYLNLTSGKYILLFCMCLLIFPFFMLLLFVLCNSCGAVCFGISQEVKIKVILLLRLLPVLVRTHWEDLRVKKMMYFSLFMQRSYWELWFMTSHLIQRVSVSQKAEVSVRRFLSQCKSLWYVLLGSVVPCCTVIHSRVSCLCSLNDELEIYVWWV